MQNTYKCPECGSEDVSVMVHVACRPTECGAEVLGDIIREYDDPALCESCPWTGIMGGLDLTPALEN